MPAMSGGVMAVECARCKTANSSDAKYCSACGNPLNGAVDAFREIPDFILNERVQAIIGQHYKDQKIIEIETTQAIANRFLEWSKLLAFFVGIPVALLFLILGVLGIRTYNDFLAQVDKAKTDVTAQVDKAKTDVTAEVDRVKTDVAVKLAAAQEIATRLKSEGDTLANDYTKLRAQFADTAALNEKFKALSDKVNVIGEKLGFTSTSSISPEVRANLESSFAKYQDYMKSLGYRSTGKSLNIDIRADTPGGFIGYYDPGKRMMVINSENISDLPVVYREYMHHVLYSQGTLNGPDADAPTYKAIESALAWYFPCSFVDDPKPSPASTAWDLTTHRPFSEVRPDLNSVLMDGTEVWGSAFWQLRKMLGKGAADKLLFDAWFKLRPKDVKTDGGLSFVRKLLDLDKTHDKEIRAVFTERGLAL
jgi:hypothetical protein